MVPKKDYSAGRKNRPATRPLCDAVDVALIKEVLASHASIEKFDEATEALKRVLLAKKVADGFRLAKASPATWDAFVADPFWTLHPKQRPKSDSQAAAVRYALRLAYGGADNGNKRANERWVAIQHLMKSGSSEQQILDQVVKGLKVKKASTEKPVGKERRASTMAASKPTTASSQSQQKTTTASIKRTDKIATTLVSIEFPKGLPGFDELEPGDEAILKVRKLGGGGLQFTAKLLGLEPQ